MYDHREAGLEVLNMIYQVGCHTITHGTLPSLPGRRWPRPRVISSYQLIALTSSRLRSYLLSSRLDLALPPLFTTKNSPERRGSYRVCISHKSGASGPHSKSSASPKIAVLTALRRTATLTALICASSLVATILSVGPCSAVMETTLDNPYIYEPLPEENCIRLFLLDGGGPGDPISGTMIVRLDEEEDKTYHALSYTWGSPFCPEEEARLGLAGIYEQKHVILCDGRQLEVTRNLLDALRELRRRMYVTIWIDAICINQTDEVEKNLQIWHIGETYSLAAGTVVWLGPQSPEVEDCLKCAAEAKQVSSMPNEDWSESAAALLSRLRDGHDPHLSLFSRTWFHRVWTLQEIALSSSADPDTLCGSLSVDMSSISLLANAVGDMLDAGIIYAAPEVHSLRIHDAVAIYRWCQLDQCADMVMTVSTRRPSFPLTGESEGLPRWMNLIEMLVYDVRGRRATDPKDKILAPFAMAINFVGAVGLMKDDRSVRRIFDPQLSLLTVYCLFTVLVLSHSCSLNILSHRDESLQDLPPCQSWVPNFAHPCHSSLIDCSPFVAGRNLGVWKPSFLGELPSEQ